MQNLTLSNVDSNRTVSYRTMTASARDDQIQLHTTSGNGYSALTWLTYAQAVELGTWLVSAAVARKLELLK
jgi:hypothetical protein